MAPVGLPFELAEYRARLKAARAALRGHGLDALLLFDPASHYYLTGFDGGGYAFFQCAVLTADEGPIALLTRRPDVAQARDASLYDEVRVWFDAEGAAPAEELRALLAERGLRGARVGVELATYGLTAANWEAVRTALDGFCALADASEVVRALRLVKSPAEIAFVRRAAALGDAATLAVAERARPGVLDGALAAACLSAVLEGGGDAPPAGPLVNSGRRGVYGRGVAGPHPLGDDDRVVVEFAATYRRYNVCVKRTYFTGEVSGARRGALDAVIAALAAMTEAARPGEPLGRIDEAHRTVLDGDGYAEQRFAACGYSLGATYGPSWMDVPPMLYTGNPTPAQPGMVLFLHAVVGDPASGVAAGVGNTLLITDGGNEVLNRAPLEF